MVNLAVFLFTTSDTTRGNRQILYQLLLQKPGVLDLFAGPGFVAWRIWVSLFISFALSSGLEGLSQEVRGVGRR
jgi:hypothetical protein